MPGDSNEKRRALNELNDSSRGTKGGKRKEKRHCKSAASASKSLETTFEKILGECGVSLSDDLPTSCNQGFKICENLKKFKDSLRNALENESTTKEEFLKDFSQFISERSNLIRSLHSFVTESSDLTTERLIHDYGDFQESLIRCLLKIDCIQPAVLNLLLEKLSEISMDADMENGSVGQSKTPLKELPGLILGQMRWLNQVVDPTGLTDKVLECIEVLPISVQRELISYLPEIVEENQLCEVVTKLNDIQLAEPSLLIAVLDAYSSMPLPSDMQCHIVEDILQLLPSAELATLPVLIRFLLDAGTSENLDYVVQQLREHVHLIKVVHESQDCFSQPVAKSDWPKDDQSRESVQSCNTLILESLKYSLKIRNDVATAYMNAMRNADKSSAHSTMDLAVLFCLFGLPEWRNRVVTFISKKISCGHINELLLSETIKGQGASFDGLFDAMLNLADSLVRSPDHLVQSFGECLYIALFSEFEEPVKRQDITGAVLVHAGSGVSHEVQSSLRVLKALASMHEPCLNGMSLLKPFAGMVKGLIQYMSSFSDSQVRNVFELLLICVSRSSEIPAEVKDSRHVGRVTSSQFHEQDQCDSDGRMDDLHIFIRKHLNHASDPSFQRVGIIGAVVFATHKAGRSTASKREAQDMIQMLFTSCGEEGSMVSFLYDELTGAVASGKVDRELMTWLADNASTPLTDKFMVDLDANGKVSKGVDLLYCGGSVRVQLRFPLDGTNTCIALNTAMVLDSILGKVNKMCSYLCPVLGLVLICERILAGTMNNVDGVLGCPILLADNSTVTQISSLNQSAQEVVFNNFFYAGEWCRELANNFILEDKEEYQLKVMHRLTNLVEIENDLIYMLKRVPDGKLGGRSIIEVPRVADKTVKSLKGKGKGKAKLVEGNASGYSSLISKMNDEDIRKKIRHSMRNLHYRVVLVLGVLEKLGERKDEICGTQELLISSLEFDMPVAKLILEELVENMHVLLSPPKKTPVFVNVAPISGMPERIFCKEISGMELCKLYFEGGVFSSLHTYLQAIARGLGIDCGSLKRREHKRKISDNVDDIDVLVSSLNLILKIISLLCSFNEMILTDYSRLVLKGIITDIIGGNLSEEEDAFVALFDIIEEFVVDNCITDLSLAVSMVKVLESISMARVKVLYAEAGDGSVEKGVECELSERIKSVCNGLLARDWSGTDSKFRYTSSTLGYLVRTLLKSTMDPLIIIEALTLEILPLLLETDGGLGPVEQYPPLRASSFALWSTPIMSCLTTAWTETDFKNRTLPSEALVLRASKMTVLFGTLIGYTKGNPALERKAVLLGAVKEGHRFIAAFIRTVPFFESCFRIHQSDILKLFKTVQQITRQLQSLCLYAKRNRDSLMMREAPTVRKVLETLIYRIKALTAAHGISGAIEVKPLKDRNIDGTELEVAEYEEDELEVEDKLQLLVEDENVSNIEESSQEDSLPMMLSKQYQFLYIAINK